MTHNYPSKPKARKKPVKSDTAWRERYKQAYYDWQMAEKGARHIELYGYVKIKYPRVGTHKGLEEAGENYVRWIGGAATNTPTLGTPKYEVQLINGRPQKVITGYHKAKGGTGKMDTDFIYKGVNFKVDWKVGNDTQKEHQKKYQAKIERAGGHYYLVHDMYELYRIIDRINEHGNLKCQLF